METIKTIVADGNEIFRYGLCSILREEPFDVSSEIDNGALVLTVFERMLPDLCILSFDLPEINGIQLANKITDKFPEAHVLIMADEPSEFVLNEFLYSGANGLLLKSADRVEFLVAAQKIAHGENYLGKQFSKMMEREYVRLARLRKRRDIRTPITKREREILHLLVEGLTSSEIAERLFISPRTVDKHRTNLLKKLGLKNTPSLVRYAIENKPLS